MNIKILKANEKNLTDALNIRIEMLKAVNDLSDDFIFDKNFMDYSSEYFKSSSQTTVLAFDGNNIIGCASICYINIMPTFSHPTGKRAHLMNVYVRSEYRKNGIAKKMIEELIDEAKTKGITEISLDATKLGRPLYEYFGFHKSEEAMCLILNH